MHGVRGNCPVCPLLNPALSSRESNPSRKMCNLGAVPPSRVAASVDASKFIMLFTLIKHDFYFCKTKGQRFRNYDFIFKALYSCMMRWTRHESAMMFISTSQLAPK